MAETKKTEKTMQSEEERLEAYYNEKVPVYIPKLDGSPDNSITVTHNGINYQIMYDTEIMVPRKVYMLIEESRRNKRRADDIASAEAGDKKIADYN